MPTSACGLNDDRLPAGAVPVHCPRMPAGVWGSVSISYLCRLLLGDTETDVCFPSFAENTEPHTHTHTPEAYHLAKTWGPCCCGLQWSDHLALFLSLSLISRCCQHRWHSLTPSPLGKGQPDGCYSALGCTYRLWTEKNRFPLYTVMQCKTLQHSCRKKPAETDNSNSLWCSCTRINHTREWN